MTELEKKVSLVLRQRALAVVTERGLSDTELAAVLDVFPDGARRLRHQKEWSVATALNVLDKMGLDVKVDVG